MKIEYNGWYYGGAESRGQSFNGTEYTGYKVILELNIEIRIKLKLASETRIKAELNPDARIKWQLNTAFI